MTVALPTAVDVRRAAARLAGQAVRTPLLASPFLDELTVGRVLIKAENLQRTGSFKFRGAFNAVSALREAGNVDHVVAVSSGNHAQGVAEAARILGLRATIVMPADAPAIKRQRTERSGARVLSYDRTREDREVVAARVMAEEGGVLVHPFNNAHVIAGQGTAGLEIAADAAAAGASLDAVLVPCGGGGLSSGVGLGVRTGFPAVEMVAVEPAGFDEYGRSLREGRILANENASGSVCDALLSRSPGEIGFAINRAHGTTGVAVSDDEALAAVAFAFRELKLVVEPGGAVALAAILSGRYPVRGRTVAIVLSGGNIDEPMLARALAAG